MGKKVRPFFILNIQQVDPLMSRSRRFQESLYRMEWMDGWISDFITLIPCNSSGMQNDTVSNCLRASLPRNKSNFKIHPDVENIPGLNYTTQGIIREYVPRAQNVKNC